MSNINPTRPRVNPGTVEARTARPKKATGRPRLEGDARRQFEKGLLENPAIRGTTRALLRTMLDECFYGHCDTWHGNGSLAKFAGISERSVQYHLKELESKSVYVMADDHRFNLVGHANRRIILKDHPDAPRLIAELQKEQMVRFDRRSGKHVSDKRRGTTQDLRGYHAGSARGDHARSAPKALTRFVKLEQESSIPPNPPEGGNPDGISDPSTKRPESTPDPPVQLEIRQPEPEPQEAVCMPPLTAPVAKADVSPDPAPDVAPEWPDPSWTDGQKELWEHLTPEQRTWVIAMNPGKRQFFILGGHVQAFSPSALEFQIKHGYLAPPSSPAPLEPEPTMPGTFAELIAALVDDVPHAWTIEAAGIMTADFGSEADRKLWAQFYEITQGVWRNQIDPDHVISAHHQAMRDGIRNRGAKFWAAFQALSGLDSDKLKDPKANRNMPVFDPDDDCIRF